jgi:hypothetical protein
MLRWLFHRQVSEQAVDDELQSFLEMAAADKMRDGQRSSDSRRERSVRRWR